MSSISNSCIEKENSAIKGKVHCIERDDSDDVKVLCTYIVQENIKIIEYEVDNDEIEKEEVKVINYNQKFITSKLEVISNNAIIICGITTENKISCFILNNELLEMNYKNDIIINCDITTLVFELSIIEEERFIVIYLSGEYNDVIIYNKRLHFCKYY